MPMESLFRTLAAALPHHGERRFKNGTMSMLVTRNDLPFTIISAMVKTEGRSGWITFQVHDGKIETHHPRNPDLLEQAVELFIRQAPASAAS